jgi:hypothetical protein
MPQIVKELTVNAPIESAWALVSDMERFSLCIPGCREVKKISDNEYDWVMEAKVLRTTRKVTARTRAEVMKPPTHSEFAGEGRLFERSNHYRLMIRGTTDLEPVAGGGTRIVFKGDVSASGVGGSIIDKVASGQMDELFDEFTRNVRATLGEREPPAREQPAAPAAAPAPAAGVRTRWLIGAAIAIIALGLLALLTA